MDNPIPLDPGALQVESFEVMEPYPSIPLRPTGDKDCPKTVRHAV